MDIVRFDSQERVDLPDMTQVSFLVLGEFRRTLRTLVLGEEAMYVVRGFAIEPAGVPDATVTIKLDNAGTLGAMILSENTGSVEYGQLVGNKDAAGNPEGASQQILDFTGQPTGTYSIEVRFVYSDSANDNRAFWNETTNTEFISATDTRHKPVWQAQYVLGAGTGGEWLKLGEVVWGGSTVTAGNITDLRPFLFEGTAGTFDGADQATDGRPDFNRSSDRAANGLFSIAENIRGLWRQIQDIKGPDASGNYNGYARVYGPIDPAASGVPATQTKTLRSVDTVTYTVGDGVGSFGDFNGATGLQDALDALANGSTRPRRAKIVIKGSDRSNVTFTVANTYDLTASPGFEFTLEIVAETVNGVSEGDNGRAAIDFSGAGGAAGVIQVRKLILRNLACLHTTAGNTLFSVDECDIRDCELTTTFSALDLTSGYYALSIDRPSARALCNVVDCDIAGPVKVVDSGGAPINRIERRGLGVFRNCSFTSPIVLHDFVESAGTNHASFGLLFEGCTMQTTSSRTSQRGVLDGGFARNVTLRECALTVSDREINGIHLAEQTAGTPPAFWKIEGCTFNISDTARTSGVDAGQFGANGTGWGIFILQTNVPAPEALEDTAAGFIVRDCYFQGPSSVPTNNDSGAIYVAGAVTAHIEDNTFWRFSAPAGGRSRVIEFRSVKVDGGIVVRGNHISKWLNSTGTSELVGVFLNDTDGADISANTIVGERDTGAILTLDVTSSAAVEVRSSTEVNVHHNRFLGWPVDAVIGIERVVLTGVRYCKFDHNVFVYTGVSGGYCIDFSNGAVEWCTANGNSIAIPGSTGRGINGSDASNLVINDNIIDMNASADPNGIDFNAGTAESMCSGNRVDGGNIAGAGAGVVYGFQNSARNDLNFYP